MIVNIFFFHSSIGISSSAIRADDVDNWLFDADGNRRKEWMSKDTFGQIFFDRFGRPAVLVLMSPYCFFERCIWLFEYSPNNSWTLLDRNHEFHGDLSRNLNAISFKKSNLNY